MAIELISTVIPKNNQTYPIALANDIKGGLHSVSSIEERDNIPQQRLQNGMLCYVNNDKMYQYIDGTWIDFYSGSGNSSTSTTYIVDTKDELLTLDTTDVEFGTLCYVKDEVNLYYFTSDGWKSFILGKNYYIGSTPPSDTNLLWIDTSSANVNESFLDSLLAEVRACISEQNLKINELNVIIKQQSTRILQLESEVEALKDAISSGDIIVTSSDSILTEDGDTLITEDGYTIILESSSTDEIYILTENNEIIITELGEKLTLE